VLRQIHQDNRKNFSPSYLCLLNHTRAWEIAKSSNKPVLVVEADFVPVIGIGKLPLPFDLTLENVGIAWLYTCAPCLHALSGKWYLEGTSVSTVAYIITPKGACSLLGFAEEIAIYPGPTQYTMWDTKMWKILQDKELKTFLPFRNYGEHGGIPNPEHRNHGLSPAHRADVLYGKLAFLPSYTLASNVPHIQYYWVRLNARLKGIVRLLLGKYISLTTIQASDNSLSLAIFAIRRFFV